MVTKEPEYLTIREAAELLRVSVPTIRRWVRAGTLRAERPGGRTLRIRRDDIRLAGRQPMLAEWLDRTREDLAEQLRKRRGVPFSSSVPIIHEAREAMDARW